MDRVWPNFVLYTQWLLEAETPLDAPRRWRRRSSVAEESRRYTPHDADDGGVPRGGPGALPAYYVFEVWWYLRFLLPAYPPLLAATGAVVVTGIERVRWPMPAIAATSLVVVAVALHGLRYSDAFTLQRDEQRYIRVADYVKHLPKRAVFVSLLHSGSIRYYTGRDVLRWELVDPASLDTAIAYLRARGHDVYLVADNGDVAGFKERFANTRAVRDLTRRHRRTLVACAFSPSVDRDRCRRHAGDDPIVAEPAHTKFHRAVCHVSP